MTSILWGLWFMKYSHSHSKVFTNVGDITYPPYSKTILFLDPKLSAYSLYGLG